jgi:hypothetical protein
VAEDACQHLQTIVTVRARTVGLYSYSSAVSTAFFLYNRRQMGTVIFSWATE